MKTLILAFLIGSTASAKEPGYLKNQTPPPPKKLPLNGPQTPLNLANQFATARGLTESEIKALHYNRVACARRIYSNSGLALEGDADLKVTAVTEHLYEAEFPSFIRLSAFDPNETGIDTIETSFSRQLVSFKNWPEKAPLKLFKSVRLRYEAKGKKDAKAYVMDEFKILEEGYPPKFIVKETVSSDSKRQVFYFICQ